MSKTEKKDHLIHQTTSLCKVCQNGVPAQVMAMENGEVWMFKTCPEHGEQNICLSPNAEWYEKTLQITPPKTPPEAKTDIKHGCPFDCGPCGNHEQKIRLPIVNINSSCNLDCPICYVYNKNKDAYEMELDEFKKILNHLVNAHGKELDLINFTGGEPTLHPHFLEFIEASIDAGIHRVSLCTNGIALVQNEKLLEAIHKIKGRIALSFDSFEEEADFKMQGAHLVKLKLRCIELLEKYDINTTLIPVITKGYNDHEIGKMIDLAISKTNIRHLEFHLITYTGQGGTSFDRSGRINLYEVLKLIEEQTNGWLTPDDFIPSPCAHPLCYQIVYLLMDPDGGQPIPFTHFFDRETMYSCMADRLYLEPSPRLEKALQLAIDRLWCEGTARSEHILKIIKRMLGEVFPKGNVDQEQALKASEKAIKAIYIHSHMDEENFDTLRAAQCCDADCFADGTTIPVCNYNVLYRNKQPQFNTHPKSWNERKGGQYNFSV